MLIPNTPDVHCNITFSTLSQPGPSSKTTYASMNNQQDPTLYIRSKERNLELEDVQFEPHGPPLNSMQYKDEQRNVTVTKKLVESCLAINSLQLVLN